MPGKRYEEATTNAAYIPEDNYNQAYLPKAVAPEGDGWVLKAVVPMPVDRHGHMEVVFYWQRDVTPVPVPKKRTKERRRRLQKVAGVERELPSRRGGKKDVN